MIISRRTVPWSSSPRRARAAAKWPLALSQLYHEHKRGIQAGYAKYETFPIWNLPLKHPVNLAYEAATADLADVNMIDPFHLEAYGETAVNYNRDIEIFPVLEAMFRTISTANVPTRAPPIWASIWRATPSWMTKSAARRPGRRLSGGITRRPAPSARARPTGSETQKLEVLMRSSGIAPQMRRTVPAALDRAAETGGSGHSHRAGGRHCCHRQDV